MMEEVEDFGGPDTNVSLRTNSLNDKRYPTDHNFKYAPIIVLLVWLLTINAVIITNMDWQNSTTNTTDSSKNVESLKDWLQSRNIFKFLVNTVKQFILPSFTNRYPLVIFGILSALICLTIFLVMLRYFTKFWIRLGIFCILILLIQHIINIIGIEYPLKNHLEFLPPMDLIVLNSRSIPVFYYIVQIILCIVALTCLRTKEIVAINDIVEKIMCTLSSFWYLIIFGLVIVILEIVILSVTIWIIFVPVVHGLVCYITSLAAIYIVSFIHYNTKMIISLTISNSYWVQDESRIAKTSIFECITTVTRYHLGTAALGAMPFLPFFVALIVACEQKIDKTKKDFHRIMNFILVTYLTCNITSYSTILTSIHGQSFYKSTQTAFHILTRRSTLSIAFTYISYALISMGTTIIIVAAMAPSLIWFQHWFHDLEVVAINCSLILAIPVFLLFDIFGQVYLLCFLEYVDNTETPKKSTNPISSNMKIEGK